jgi:hypothetical protein
VDADQGDLLEAVGLLDDLVRDPGQGALDRLGVENRLTRRASCGAQGSYPVAGLLPAGCFMSSPFRPLGTGLKGVPEED